MPRGGKRKGTGRNPLPPSMKRRDAHIKLTGDERVRLLRVRRRLGLSGSEAVGLLLGLYDAGS